MMSPFPMHSKLPGRPNPMCRFAAACPGFIARWCWVIVWMCAVNAGLPVADADDLRRKTKFWAQLNAPMTAVVDGMPLRDALERVCQPVGLNLCLDRKVDPTTSVEPGTLGPTVFVALRKIALTRDCVVMPIFGVVLIGRPSWVDATVSSLSVAAGESSTFDDVDVVWPELTSGNEALAAAMNRASADVNDLGLPHDLWAANQWKQIDPRVAVSLVLAQFDLQLSEPLRADTEEIIAEPLDGQSRLDRTYSADSHQQLLRRSIESADPESRFLVDQDMLLVKATAASHRIGTDALLVRWAETFSADNQDDSKTFSLRRTETSAGAALMQFAQAAGRQCVINADAVQACRKPIVLEAEDETLKSLINRVARQAGVHVQWHAKKIVVTAAPE